MNAQKMFNTLKEIGHKYRRLGCSTSPFFADACRHARQAGCLGVFRLNNRNELFELEDIECIGADFSRGFQSKPLVPVFGQEPVCQFNFFGSFDLLCDQSRETNDFFSL